MNVHVTDIRRKKTIGSVIGAGIMIVFMIVMELLIWWGNTEDPLPGPVLVIFLGIPVLVTVGVFVVLMQRIREIRKGEEDEASKY